MTSRLKDVGGAPAGVSSGRFTNHDRNDGTGIASADVIYWDTVTQLDEVIQKPAPAGYSSIENAGYEAANSDVTLGHRMPWQWTAGQLERKYAVASDEGAPWRDGGGDEERQAELDAFWDARADRLLELWSTFNSVAPFHLRGEAEADPNGCADCGRDPRSHGLYSGGRGGLHGYITPTDEQRLLRMRHRRAAHQ